MVKSTNNLVCRACHKHFVFEDRYIKHECKQLKREKELKSNQGQTALYFYQLWLRQSGRVPSSTDYFIMSKHFRTFVNFAIFVKKVQLPLPKTFIWWTIKKNFPPTMWMFDQVYTQYIEFIDNSIPPLKLVNNSIDTILKFTDACDVDSSEFFELIQPNELIHLIRLRKLSPWILLVSKKFSQKFSQMNNEQQAIIETLIPADVWGERKANHLSDLASIKKLVAELGL
ncbi:MAG: hypothetical protein ACXW2E_00320 [Nitrososphaeraceae archaeon]